MLYKNIYKLPLNYKIFYIFAFTINNYTMIYKIAPDTKQIIKFKKTNNLSFVISEQIISDKLNSFISILDKEYSFEDGEICGLNIKELFSEFGIYFQVDVNKLMQLYFNEWEIEENLFIKLMRLFFIKKNGSGDCPVCGFDLETFQEGCNGIEWEDKSCENPFCEHEETGEPDWDNKYLKL